MAPNKDEKSLVDRLRAFQKSNQANKRCADCPERGPTYVCLDFMVFVCQTCCGLHREFGHKIKSISFSEWSEAEVAKLEEGGNEAARTKWLDRWHAEAFPEPDGGDVEALREFIRLKYVEKKWFRPHGKTQTSETIKAAAPETPAATVGYEASAPPSAPSQTVDLLSGGDPDPTPAQAPAPVAKAEVSDLLGGLDLGQSEEQPWTADFSNVSNLAPKAPVDLGAGAGLIDLDFGTSPPKAAAAVPEVIDTSARVPVEEPAVEPAPAEAPDDNLSLGEKLRQAVMSGSQDDLKRLFEQCSRAPPKKAVDADHLAAFAAFDDLLKPPEEVEPAVRPPEGGSGGFAGDLLGDGPSTSVARIPAEAQSETAEAAAQSNGQLGSGPAMFFIGDDPQEETPDFAALAAGGGGGAEPRLTPRRVEQLMSNGTGSNLTPQQLERLSPQELLQLQAMISSALQARAPPPQPVSSMRSPAPAPWQATAYRPADRIASFDLAQKDPEQQAPFGELLDMFQKKNTLGSS